jgi:ABC-type amino acid transport system permease subunit
MYITAAAMYWIMSSVLAWLQHRAEARASQHVRVR